MSINTIKKVIIYLLIVVSIFNIIFCSNCY